MLFGFCNQAGALKISRHYPDAFDVLGVILPRILAWAKLPNATALSINNGSRRRIQALVSIIWNTVTVPVEWQYLSAYFITGNVHSIASNGGHVHVPLAA